jgi:transposase-like protein
MDFPLSDVLDPQRCYDFLLELLHPQGLRCPCGHPLERCGIHMRDRAPILDYRCWECGRFFNVFSDTVFEGTQESVVQIIPMVRGIATGTPTARLAREIEANREQVLVWRHKLQGFAEEALCRKPLPDQHTEGDEMYQNAGEKRRQARRPHRPAALSR